MSPAGRSLTVAVRKTVRHVTDLMKRST